MLVLYQNSRICWHNQFHLSIYFIMVAFQVKYTPSSYTSINVSFSSPGSQIQALWPNMCISFIETYPFFVMKSIVQIYSLLVRRNWEFYLHFHLNEKSKLRKKMWRNSPIFEMNPWLCPVLLIMIVEYSHCCNGHCMHASMSFYFSNKKLCSPFNWATGFYGLVLWEDLLTAIAWNVSNFWISDCKILNFRLPMKWAGVVH